MTGAFALMHGNYIHLKVKQIYTPKKITLKWRRKEKLVYGILKELFDIVKQRPWYDIGVPDYEVNNNTIIEVKSTLDSINIEQFERYASIGKQIFIVVIENKGTTDLPDKYIITIDNLIDLLPYSLKEKYIIIKNDILS